MAALLAAAAAAGGTGGDRHRCRCRACCVPAACVCAAMSDGGQVWCHSGGCTPLNHRILRRLKERFPPLITPLFPLCVRCKRGVVVPPSHLPTPNSFKCVLPSQSVIAVCAALPAVPPRAAQQQESAPQHPWRPSAAPQCSTPARPPSLRRGAVLGQEPEMQSDSCGRLSRVLVGTRRRRQRLQQQHCCLTHQLSAVQLPASSLCSSSRSVCRWHPPCSPAMPASMAARSGLRYAQPHARLPNNCSKLSAQAARAVQAASIACVMHPLP